MGWMPKPKDKDWLNGYKNKTCIYAVRKIPTSKQGTPIDWKWRAGKRYFTQIETKKTQRNKKTNKKKKKKQKNRHGNIHINKIDIKINDVKNDKEGHFTMIKWSIQELDIILICAPNIGALQYVRQVLTSVNREINSNTIIMGDFNIQLTPMDRSTR